MISFLNYLIFILFIVCCFYSSYGYYFEISKPQSNTDICTKECIKTVAISSNNVATSKSCARGCRFFDIAQLIYFGNSTRTGCFSYCDESYRHSQVDLISCKTGCSSSKPRFPMEGPLIAEISWSFFIEGGDASDQEETLMDPSYKDQFASLEDFKLSEMKVRGVPVKHEGSGYWRGVPHCLIASLLLLLVILALLLGLVLDDSPETLRKDDYTLNEAPALPEKFPIV